MTSAPTSLISINSGAIAELADGTKWRIAQGENHIDEARRWRTGTKIVVSANPRPEAIWQYILKNLDTGTEVAALPVPPKY
jgi:hypothetical protein